MENLSNILYLSAAIAAISLTVTRAVVFRWWREWVDSKNKFIGELFTCPYCFSHWLSIAAVIIYQPRLVTSNILILDLIVSIFVMVTVSSLFCGLVVRAFMFDEEEE